MSKQPGVCKLYEQIADWFDNARTKTLMEKEYLNLVLSQLDNNASILDLGCGTGEPIARFFIENGHSITGIDGSRKMITTCKARFPEMEWIEDDMRNVNLKRHFDVVIAWDSLFHLNHADQRNMFKIFYDHIKPHGILIFTSGHKYGEVYSKMDGHIFYHASLDTEEYKGLLHQYGFEILLHKIEDPDCGEHTVWVTKCL